MGYVDAVDGEELGVSRARLEGFLREMLAGLGRSERGHWGEVYVRGLLATSTRKSSARMAAETVDGDTQALQQFVGQSPWEWEPLRKKLSQWMVGAVAPAGVWIVDDTGFPKKGKHSVGVARQYSGTMGKVDNCQIAVSLHYATDEVAFPLDFQLYLPEEWLSPERRREARIPVDVSYKTKGAIALDLIDNALAWAIPAGVVTADSGYGDSSGFRLALSERGLQYAVAVDGVTTVWTTTAWPEEVDAKDVGPPEKRHGGSPRRVPRDVPPQSAREAALGVPEAAWQTLEWREGTKGPMTGRFAAIRVRPAHGYRRHEAGEPPQWLLIEQSAPDKEPTSYWLCTLPASSDLLHLVRIARMRWWIEQGYQQLKDELGLDHYEGRGWQGWHHHVTLTMVAFAFLALERMRAKKNFWIGRAPAADSGPAT